MTYRRMLFAALPVAIALAPAAPAGAADAPARPAASSAAQDGQLLSGPLLSGQLLSGPVGGRRVVALPAATRVLAQAVPAAPAVPALPTSPGAVSSPLDARTAVNGAASNPVTLVLLLGSLSFLPALLVMVTAFTRIVIVLGFTRTALGTQGIPPNQVIIGLALFLTFFVMAPTFKQANDTALQPYLKGQISQSQAYDKGLAPFRGFMLKQVRDKDLQLFVDMSGKGKPKTPSDLPTTTLVPAFLISELRTAFLIGFLVFVPFVVIDLVVSAALSAMGMAMLPPSLISLPFKILLFVAVDGWYLLVSSLVKSFH